MKDAELAQELHLRDPAEPAADRLLTRINALSLMLPNNNPEALAKLSEAAGVLTTILDEHTSMTVQFRKGEGDTLIGAAEINRK